MTFTAKLVALLAGIAAVVLLLLGDGNGAELQAAELLTIAAVIAL